MLAHKHQLEITVIVIPILLMVLVFRPRLRWPPARSAQADASLRRTRIWPTAAKRLMGEGHDGTFLVRRLRVGSGHGNLMPSSAVNYTCVATAPPPQPPAWWLPADGRPVFALGDLHGDWGKTISALELAGAINSSEFTSGEPIGWAGGDRIVVQLGDVLDRKDSELGIANLLDCLAVQAEVAGGKLLRILGNHELMNAAGDLRYATAVGTQQYGGPRGRSEAFSPGGEEAQRLARLNVVQMVGDTSSFTAGCCRSTLHLPRSKPSTPARRAGFAATAAACYPRG